MSRSESANVLSGVGFILRTSSGPAFPADHTAIDTAHPKVVDRNNQASVGRMTAFCGTPRFYSSDQRLLSAHLPRCRALQRRSPIEPIAAAQPRRQEPLFMPHTRLLDRQGHWVIMTRFGHRAGEK